ncbi:neurochondrin [Salvia hispanica]|uniref:neurochondrin n=1 Tax=Salvia hispanica TaxID=49212 RepID=UPI002008F9CA|nr:neurochondrin [Salvia hispanica]
MEQQTSTSSLQASPSPSPSLEDVMRLLKGNTDSQRLAGLLLVTKFFDKNDKSTILSVYNAVGSTFLHRLLLTGMGKGGGGANIDNADRHAYLQLSLTILASFARLPELAATHEMLSKIPLVLELMPNQSNLSLTEQCFEFLFLVTTAQEDGAMTFYRSGGMNVLASQMHALPDGSHVMELAMKLVQFIISKLPAENVCLEHPSELSKMVSVTARQFARLHNALKFEALHLLSALLSSSYSGVLCSALQSLKSDDWSVNLRVGVMDVLQNRVGPAEKLHALVVAQHAISIVGEDWLIGPTNLPDGHSSFPAERCILLVLESSRVEIAVLVNELAYLKYEASENSPPDSETFLGTLRNLGVVFSLVERIIKLMSKLGENEESNSAPIINDSTLMKMIGGLNETIGVVLDYLQDAKDHGDRKGDDLLASVRVVGSYLAEAPPACNEKVKDLLGYMLSVEGDEESSPFQSISFLLPLLCQITMENDGCKLFASAGAFGAVVGFLISLIDSSDSSVDNIGTILVACDTILNFLLKREQFHFTLENPCSVKLLQALVRWTANTSDVSMIMMASSICSLILDSTSEEALMRYPEFNADDLVALSLLMKRSLVTHGQDMMSGDGNSEADLYEIVTSGYDSWADRFPHIKQVVGR